MRTSTLLAIASSGACLFIGFLAGTHVAHISSGMLEVDVVENEIQASDLRIRRMEGFYTLNGNRVLHGLSVEFDPLSRDFSMFVYSHGDLIQSRHIGALSDP
jgi:hypothetical protein